MSSQSTEPRIQALPKKVVDRIAAGEVVQRPASVIKELIENSLDADSTNIDVQCQGGGLRLLSVSDDGFGIHPQDLPLAATRFATSKLKQWDDLKQIQTFGFRGEALASASMVGRLSIVSRKRKLPSSGGTSCAFKMSYSDGEPTSKALPSAGKEGTCVKLQDLFYNLPSRKRAFEGTRKENEEYQKILNVVQRYSVHKADHGIGFVCRKKGGQTDLNTASIATIKKLRKQIAEMEKMEEITDSLKTDLKALKEQSTRDVIGHVYGSEMAKELLPISCSKGDVEKVTLSALEAMKNEESTLNSEKSEMKLVTEGNSLMDGLVVNMHDYGANIAKETESQTMAQSGQGQFSFAYRCRGFITNGSYCVPKASSAFLLFINGRLVESAALKKAVESVYMDMLPKGAKPFVYLSLELPGPHLDVNVHPTKREVAFLHEDQLCEALASSVRELLQDSSTSRTFYTQTLLVGNSTTMKLSSQEEEPRVLTTNTKNSVKPASKSDNDNDNVSKKNNQEEVSKRKATSEELSSKKRKVYDPKNLIRTTAAAEQGALEPFLVLTQPKSSSQDLPGSNSSPTSDEITEQGSSKPKQDIVHAPECIFASGSKKIDMSIPGAFASICRCQVEQASSLPKLTGFTQNIMRPKKIKPTKCSYTSIQNLRKDIQNRANNEFTSKLRNSVFVGCISRSRCLIQSGIELIMINPYELSKETFYQLALLRFGGFQKASLEGDGLQVQTLIEKALEMDEALKPSLSLSQKIEHSEESKDLTHDETNIDLARQATVCLAEKSAMLEEYFSIEFEMDKDNETLYLKGLPVILDGHFPSPQHLPAFLLYLATEVDYTDEMKCFEGVCTELSRYYAEVQIEEEAVTVDQEHGESRLELISESEKKYIQHTLYPAFRFLLVVPKDFASDGTFCKLAVLSKLYKVFERC